MEIKKAVEKLEASKKFKEFVKKNPHYELAHAFTMVDKIQGPWQIGYYSKKKDRVVVFEVDKHISMSAEEEVFKEPEKRVNGLDLDKVKITLEKAINVVEHICKKAYPNEITNKIIVVLQTLEKPVYNITLTTETFNMINMRVDAGTGSVEGMNIQSILSLKRTDI